jgi:hypothetical protein
MPYIEAMKPVVVATALWLSALPAAAQEADVEEGMDLLSEGTRLLLRGLLAEMEPALRDLRGALDGLNAYHPPEMLPNGDIIIRRKTPEEIEATPPDGDEIEI